jgi:cytochrome c biogenesis protein CcdA
MLKQIVTNYRKKSLKERFLLFIGVLFLMIYLTLGVILIFWTKFPIRMETKYRIALGSLLIVYGFFRFWRLLKTDSDD